MAYYLQRVDNNKQTIDDLFALIPEDKKQEGAELIARTVNAALVCCQDCNIQYALTSLVDYANHYQFLSVWNNGLAIEERLIMH